MPGCIPIRRNGTDKLAEAPAQRTSQANARAAPAPIAGPLIAAIVGTSSSRIVSQVR